MNNLELILSSHKKQITIMDPDLVKLLQGELGELPYQSAVYVIYCLREQRIDVMSWDVNSKYSITKTLIECEESQATRSLLKNYLRESTIHNGSDFAGFFDGVSPGPLINLMEDNTNRQPVIMDLDTRNANTILIPYGRYTLTNDQRLTFLGQDPITTEEDSMYGPWTVTSSAFGDGDLSVSLPLQVMSSYYVFAKIDSHSCMFIGDQRVPPKYASTDEILLTSKFSVNDKARLRDNAVNLVRQVIEHPPGFEQVDGNIKRIAMMSRSWPVRQHDHLTIG